MKRYLVFEFDKYDPAGGILDLVESTDNLNDAYRRIENLKVDTILQVYDSKSYHTIINISWKSAFVDNKWINLKYDINSGDWLK